MRGVESGIDGLYAESLNCGFIVVLLRPMSMATFLYCELVKFCKLVPSMLVNTVGEYPLILLEKAR